MNRNQVKPTQRLVTGLKKQMQKYDRLQTGSMYLGYSKAKRKFILRGKRI